MRERWGGGEEGVEEGVEGVREMKKSPETSRKYNLQI